MTKQRRVTNGDLAHKIDGLVQTLEDLAGMTQRGFLEQKAAFKAVLQAHRQESRGEHADILFKLSEKADRTELKALELRVDTLEAQPAV